MTENILAAQAFAHQAHDSIRQTRKYSGEPYWVHTDEVANTVREITVNYTPVLTLQEAEDMIVAAHLHDYREDVVTELTKQGRLAELAEFESRYNRFSERAKQYVADLTDVYIKENYPHLNRAERKRLERERLSKISHEAKTIKLADLISNTKSIVAEDAGFAKTYLKEKFALLGDLAEGSPILLQRASEQTIEGFQKLGLTIPMITASLHV